MLPRHCKLLMQSCLTLCHPMDYSSPSSSVHGILQARILEWVAIPFSRRSSRPRDQIWVSHIVARFFALCRSSVEPQNFSLLLYSGS